MRNKIVAEDLQYICTMDLPWQSFKNKSILVAGANGFLPAYMVETLLFLNEQDPTMNTRVIALVRNRQKGLTRFKHYQSRTDFRLLVQDVCQPVTDIARADFIIHAASQASPKYYAVDPVGTLTANVLGTANLLELAQRSHAEGFLFFSSGEVYGKVDDSLPAQTEENYGYLDPTAVRSCYGEGKRAGEALCAAWAAQYQVPAKIVRPSHTYGPGMSFDDGRVFADFVADIVQNKDIVMKSDGSAIRPFCYLSDAIRGYFTVLLKGKTMQPYNIGNPDGSISILELAQRLVKLFPERGLKVVRVERQTGDTYLKSSVIRGCPPDIGKARQLGWNPKIGVDEGFFRTVKSYE